MLIDYMASKNKDNKKNKSKDKEQNKEGKSASEAVIDKILQSVTTGLGLVTALAWNEAIQGSFNRFLSKPAGLTVKFVYAIVLTVIIVLVTLQLTKLAKKISKK